MSISIDQFIQELSNENKLKNVFNQYSSNWVYSNITRSNLKMYLERMLKINPSVILIGEAPGYIGCKLTGIPFTSERLLIKSKFFSSNLGENFIVRDIYDTREERSANVVWNAFEKNKIIPLLWNVFPLHPHEKNEYCSNRKPLVSERTIGEKYIKLLLEMYNLKEIYAVGNKAHETLIKMGLDVDIIRHPSYGGKEQFLLKVEAIAE